MNSDRFPLKIMKIKFALVAALLSAAASLEAAVLSATTAVHLRTDEASPVVSYLKAGSTVEPAPDTMASTPAGWMAIELPGPFELYVQNKEIGKSLDVRPGADLHLLPKLESTVLTKSEKGDRMEITGLRGKWTQVKLTRKITGYVRVSTVPFVAHAPASSTAAPIPAPSTPSASSTPAPLAPAPVQPSAYGVSSGGQAAPMVDLGDGGSATLPRIYEGRFASTRRPFAPKRPYDYQINDSAGVRFAYLDLSKLMLTEALEKYLDRTVAVFGTASNVPGTRDIVIAVESLQLK